jgi:hypothetical protein
MEIETVSQNEQIDERRALIMALQALVDPEMLRVLAALGQAERSLPELAEELGVPASFSRGPLGRLIFLEIVAVREHEGRALCKLSRRRLHTLNGALQRLSRDLFASTPPATPADSAAIDEAERRILRSCFQGDQLREIPSRPERLRVVLRWLSSQFAPERRYHEREINALIKRYHADSATLRRHLIDYGYMRRANDFYWLAEAAQTSDE